MSLGHEKSFFVIIAEGTIFPMRERHWGFAPDPQLSKRDFQPAGSLLIYPSPVSK